MSEMQPPDPPPSGAAHRCPKCMRPGEAGAKFCGSCGSGFDVRPLSPGDPPIGSVIGERYEMGLALGATPYGRAFIAWDKGSSAAKVLVASQSAQAFASELDNPADAEQSARYFAGRSLTSAPPVEGAATASELIAVGDRLITVFDEAIGRSLVNADTLLDALEARDRPPQPQETLGLFAPIAGALQGLHGSGRLHGRVSPHTVYVGAGAPAMLLDVPSIQGGGDPQSVALLDGPYAAPELREGQPATPASDVYGLAATIFRALTARTPAGRSKHEIVSDVQQAGAPSAAGEVLAQALAESPADRFGAVQPFWQAYQASYVKPPAPAWPKMVAAVLLVLLIVGGGVFLGFQYGPQLLAAIQGGPKIVLEGPEDPVPVGGDAEIRWEAPADAAVTLDGNAVDPSGATVVSGVDADRRFVLTATLADGAVEERTYDLRVAAEELPGETPGAVEITFEGPTEPVPQGGAARLSWNVRGAADVTLNGRPVDPVGSYMAGGVTADETHTLEVIAPDGTRETREALIRVESASSAGGPPTEAPPPPSRPARSAPPPPPPTPPMALSFVASSLSVPHGGDVELRWEAVNARSVTLDGASVPLKGTHKVSGLRVDSSYVLAAVGRDGSRDQRRLEIRVAKPGAPSILSFAADPVNILPGAVTTLRWQVEGNISNMSIKPGARVAGMTGTLQVKPSRTTEYTLSVEGPGGKVEASTVIQVRPPAPSVTFSADPPSVGCQEATQLVWNVSGANDVNIDPEPGRVGASGNERVRPGRDRTYTLTARGPGGVTSKQVDVRVEYKGPSTGTILVKRRVQSGLSFEVPGFPCAPVDISVVGDPLEMVQPPTSRGGQWVAYFKSTRSGNREIQSMIRWTVKR